MLRQSFRRQRLLSDLRRGVFLEEFLAHRFRCFVIDIGQCKGPEPKRVRGLLTLEQLRSLQAMFGETVAEETVTRCGPCLGGVDARVLLWPDYSVVFHAFPIGHRNTWDEFPSVQLMTC